MECIAPGNTDKKDEESFERDKRLLLEKLELIENPIVLIGPVPSSRGNFSSLGAFNKPDKSDVLKGRLSISVWLSPHIITGFTR